MPGKPPGTELSIAIAGSDSTGLTAALACQAAGFANITVYGSDHRIENPLGTVASVELSPNASRIVRTLKALDALTEDCFEPQFIHQRSYRTGFQLSIQALGAMAEGRYHAPFLHITHQKLCERLRAAAKERGVAFCSAAIQALSQTGDKVTLGIPTQGDVKHDVLIVAADPEHKIRKLTNAQPITYHPTRFRHWQAEVAQDHLPPGAFGPVITAWLGPDHHISYHFGANSQQLHLSAITAHASPADAKNTATASTAKVADAFKDWHPSLKALIKAADTLQGANIKQSVSPQRLAHGNVVFLATSCHSILPHLPQQAALGIEDAWVVARMLEQWEEEPAGGWVEYEKYRLPRARRMQDQAIERAAALCEPNASKAWARNLGLSLSSRFLPELAMQKNDWLYGYDAVNGFE